MKKLLAMMLVALFALTCNAEAEYYKYLFTVMPSGVKTQRDFNFGSPFYVELNGYNLAIDTGADGTKSGGVYCTWDTEDGESVIFKGLNYDDASGYGAALIKVQKLGFSVDDVKKVRMRFSSDFTRLNIYIPGGLTQVLERATSPEDESAPTQMY